MGELYSTSVSSESEVATGGVLYKKAFLEISQNSDKIFLEKLLSVLNMKGKEKRLTIIIDI